jgi:hypothetical protein
MSDLKALAETMKSWSDTAGDHHWQAGCALEQMVGLHAQVERLRGVASVVAAGLRPVLPLYALQLDCAVAETPAQSIAHIEAAVLRRVAGELLEVCVEYRESAEYRVGVLNCQDWLDGEAERLERDAPVTGDTTL